MAAASSKVIIFVGSVAHTTGPELREAVLRYQMPLFQDIEGLEHTKEVHLAEVHTV